MKLNEHRRLQLIDLNTQEYGSASNVLKWINEDQIIHSTRKRTELTERLKPDATFSSKGTKISTHELSPGCSLCAQGSWSCLFINGRCNCRCFYCPSRQDEDLLPTTNTLPFTDPDEYVAYVRMMGYRGVSFSGGEPLLKLRETLSYIRATNKAFGDSVHTWLYTNGTLASESALRQLGEAGLDEIRFDIGATGLKLDAAKRAVNHINTVTVEIPCLPEQIEILKEKIVEMHQAGVKHLNLHQLRLTTHNLPHLVKRDYTYLHGEKVTVLESELAALALIDWTLEQGIDMPINYCSFVYKNRYQRASARHKNAAFVREPYEDLTESGFIRTLSIEGDIARLLETLSARETENNTWILDESKNRLYLSASLWRSIDCSGLQTSVAYSEAKLSTSPSNFNRFATLPLTDKRNLYIEKAPCAQRVILDQEFCVSFQKWLSESKPDESDLAAHACWDRLYRFECIEEGLAEYF